MLAIGLVGQLKVLSELSKGSSETALETGKLLSIKINTKKGTRVPFDIKIMLHFYTKPKDLVANQKHNLDSLNPVFELRKTQYLDPIEQSE